ncbi:MAG: MotA/TolQ/ExbB proton channel family protein [Opitutales bacterium]
MLEQIIDIWLSGGWVMIPLALLALLIYSTALELLHYLRRGNMQLGSESDWLVWIQNPAKAAGRAGEIIRYTQDGVTAVQQMRNRFTEVRMDLLRGIDRRILFLKTLVTCAPLMGLLGTVIGMLGTFAAIAMGGGSETVSLVSGGISEALITTQTGLFIALPGVFLILRIRQRKQAIEATLARIEALSLSVLPLDPSTTTPTAPC